MTALWTAAAVAAATGGEAAGGDWTASGVSIDTRTLEPGDQIKVSGTPHKEGNPVLQIRGLVHEGKDLPLFEE